MIKIFYSEQKDQIFELYDTDSSYYYAGGLKYDCKNFIGDNMVLLDQYGHPTNYPHRIPFGKHKGEQVSDLSNNYLRWLGSIARGPLKNWCDTEMVKRFGCVLEPETWSYSSNENYESDDWEEIDAFGMSVWDFGDN